jgi:hypothetical protein
MSQVLVALKLVSEYLTNQHHQHIPIGHDGGMVGGDDEGLLMGGG